MHRTDGALKGVYGIQQIIDYRSHFDSSNAEFTTNGCAACNGCIAVFANGEGIGTGGVVAPVSNHEQQVGLFCGVELTKYSADLLIDNDPETTGE